MVICHLLAGGTCLPIQPISPFCLFNPYKHVISLNTKCLHTSAMKLTSLFQIFWGRLFIIPNPVLHKHQKQNVWTLNSQQSCDTEE